MPIEALARKTYSILVSRSGDRPAAQLYEFDLAEPIPSFPVPLQAEDVAPVVDLQQLVNEVYTRARFDLAIDYLQPIKPDLTDTEVAWVKEMLKKAVA